MWDVIIIGAGSVGCATARELMRYRLRLLVLEGGSDICAGTSKANTATVHAGFDAKPGTNKARFNMLGNRMYDELCAELEVPFMRNGLIVFTKNRADLSKLELMKEQADCNGVPVEVLDRDGLARIEPGIGDQIAAGLWAPTSGMVCPYNLVFAMAENAALNGAEFRRAARVTNIARIENGWRVWVGENYEDTRVVINCAGVSSGKLNNMVTIHQHSIIPRMGEHFLLDRKYGQYVKACMVQLPFDLPGGGHSKGIGLQPTVDGTILLGCTAIQIDDGEDVAATRDGLKQIVDFSKENWSCFPIARHVPQFPDRDVIAVFAGVRAHPETDDFILGEPDDAPGFINASGIESPGLTAAPALGVYLAGIAVDRLQPPKNESFVKGRKFKRPFRTMSREEREEAIRLDPDYAKVVCRCELVTEAEIRDAIRRPNGARSINGVKMRTRAGMGRCQGGFCSPRVLQILCEELSMDPLEVTLNGNASQVLKERVCHD